MSASHVQEALLIFPGVNKANDGDKTFRKLDERASLFFKLAGSPEQIAVDVRRVAQIVKDHRGAELVFAKNKKEQEELWRARKVALWSAMDSVPGSKCWTTDVCVPISKLPQLVREVQADCARRGVVAPIVGHGPSAPALPG